MNRSYFIFLSFAFFLAVSACKKEKEIDKTVPEISVDFSGAFPQNCDTLYFGEPFEINLKFSDNEALSSFSFDIHHNFDHHSHSTEVEECNLEPKKEPVNPFISIVEDYQIPEGLKMYNAKLITRIPKENQNGLFDSGSYHFHINLTDKSGWSCQKGLSIKILHR